MNKLSAVGKFSPVWIAAFWSIVLLAGFVSIVPQPAVIIGYIWKGELALAALIFLTLIFALKFPVDRIRPLKISADEIRFIILPLVAFTFWSALSCLWAESTRGAIHHTLLWACYVLFYVLMRHVCSAPRLRALSLKTTGIVIAVLGTLCLIEYFSTAAAISVNVSLRYSKYAEILAALLPIFIALAVGAKNRGSLLFGAVALFAWFGIVFSLGRTQFLAGLSGVLALALLIVFRRRKAVSWRKIAALAGALVLLTAITQIAAFTAAGGAQKTTLDRFAAGDAHNRTSFEARRLFWSIAWQNVREHPFAGVGADNFVTAYGTARGDLSALDPENKLLEAEENILPERAHNEFLQILSELGAVGALLFAWFAFGVLKIAASVRRKRQSLLTLGALAGIFAFFLSSLVSSYSFRITANGASFFFLLALAVHGLSKTAIADGGENLEIQKSNFDFSVFKPTFAAVGLIVCAGMLIFSAVRGASLMYLQIAISAASEQEAEANFQTAVALDGNDPLFRYYSGTRLYNVGRAAEAAPEIRYAIDRGIAGSVAYAYLASAHVAAGQKSEAEATMRESLRVYPRSVFLLTFYADFLRQNDRSAEARIEFDKALKIKPEQAESWRTAQAEGMSRLNKARAAGKTVEVMELKPTEAIYAVLDFQRQNNPKLLSR